MILTYGKWILQRYGKNNKFSCRILIPSHWYWFEKNEGKKTNALQRKQRRTDVNCIISKRESKRHFLSFQRFEFLNTLIVLFDDMFGNLTYETEPVWIMVIEILTALCFKLSNKELNFHKCPICAHNGCLSKKKGQTSPRCLPSICCSLPNFKLFISCVSMYFYTNSLPLNYSRIMYHFSL